MDSLLKIQEHLRGDADAIAASVVDSWSGIAEHEPWLALPADMDQDHLPELIRKLAAAMLPDAPDDERRRDVIWAAVKHGEQRRGRGVSENVVHAEYQLLRKTLWRYLRERFGHSDQTVQAILRIDSGITLATSGSLLGYHRNALERLGRWPEGVEQVVRDWTLHE